MKAILLGSRDPKRWPHVEEGRGVLREWARFVVGSVA